MFLDNTACNLASLNLLKFYDDQSHSFDADAYEHAVDLWTIVLEISVLMAAFPSKEIAELSYRFRTLGLGYANLGAMLMRAGIPYDSEEARAVCRRDAQCDPDRPELSRPARCSPSNSARSPASTRTDRENMLRVIRNHPAARPTASLETRADYEKLSHHGPCRSMHED